MHREQVSGKSALHLHDFLRDEREAILQQWTYIDRQCISARNLPNELVRNDIPSLLDAIADQSEKKADGDTFSAIPIGEPKNHAAQRWGLGFSLEEVTREYGFLRSVILQRLAPHIGEIPTGELIYFNAALDQAINESVVAYVSNANRVLEDERQRLKITLRSIGDGVVSTDPEGRITYLNPAAEQVSGWSRQESIGRPLGDVLVIVDAETRRQLTSLSLIALKDGNLARHQNDILLRRRDGELLPIEEIAAPLRDSTGRLLGVVTTFRDVSKIRALTMELGYLASHDPLTGLPNRTLLLDRLSQELAHAERNKSRLAVLYLDLDLFKNVNDLLGHAAGDQLLQQVAQRLQKCIRRSDTVSRLGGDEFAILLTAFGPVAYLSELGAKIAKRLRIPYTIGQDRVDISTSVGISVYPEDGRDSETLIKHADVAMYQAKARGRDNVQFFAPAMHERAIERRRLQGDLRKAIAADQLSLHFQPQFALSSGRIIGAEALLRWRHPRQGLVPPSRFIPVAEESGKIMVSLGNWVLEQVCRQARAWQDAGHAPLRISVNVSIVQLRYKSFLRHVVEVLERYQLQADQLQLELTESILMSESAEAAKRVRKLKELGLRISVDDFGTGYSSLSYLKNLPVDELKIDQSFVRDIGSDLDNGAIVQAVIRMSQSLRLRVIAEGVEDKDAVGFLTANGCEGAQGFYYSKALEPVGFEQLFLSNH